MIASKDLPNDFYSELQSFMSQQIAKLSSDIGEFFLKSSPVTPITDVDSPRYLFINDLTQQHKGYLTKKTELPLNISNTIAELFSESDSETGKYHEIMVKSTNDYWVVQKSSNHRQFCVVIHSNKSTLIDISNDVNKLFTQEIKNNVFFEQ